jgi:predicted ATPase
MSWTLGMLGYPEQARQRSREALTLAQELSHPPSLAMAQIYAGLLCAFCRDWPAVQALAKANIRLSTEHGFPYLLGGGFFCHSWTLAGQGQTEKAIAQLHESIAGNRAMGTEALVVVQLAALAEAYGQAGQVDEGLGAVTEALGIVDRTNERFYEAEVYRIKGELLLKDEALLRKGGRRRDEACLEVCFPDAESCFQRAIEVARQQQAKLWELRAVISLCCLWQEQGKREEAHKKLADIYNWFTEGFDTPDLQEAGSLLDALS